MDKALLYYRGPSHKRPVKQALDKAIRQAVQDFCKRQDCRGIVPSLAIIPATELEQLPEQYRQTIDALDGKQNRIVLTIKTTSAVDFRPLHLQVVYQNGQSAN